MRPHVVHWLAQYVRADVADVLAPTWFMCVGFAGLVTLVLMLVLARRRGIDSGTIASTVLWAYVAAVAAGIVVPMLIDGVQSLVMTGRFHLRWAGMTSFWGYLAGIAAAALVCRREGLALGRLGDLAVIPLGLALAFARLGCFMAGCDYGKVSSLPWAVRFPAGSPAWRDQLHAGLLPANRLESLPVHPTELYEAVLGLVIIAIAIYVARQRRKEGQVFVFAAATYAIGRFGIETLRGDAGRGIYAGLSSGQIFSLLVLAAIAARYFLANRRAITAIAAGALVLAIANVGEADAQPAPPSVVDGAAPPAAVDPIAPPGDTAVPAVEQFAPEQPPVQDLAERPKFAVGALFGVATPLNRRAGQVPTLAGASVSIGYLPGRFGCWLDLDSYANSDASHTTFLVSGSYMRRFGQRFGIGGRIGLGPTRVNFADPAFRDVLGTTIRVEAIAEYALARNWAIWVRPLTIDTLSSASLGGPITTYQFRIGFAFRFGSRHNAVHPAAPLPAIPPPDLPPDPEPAPYPTLGAL